MSNIPDKIYVREFDAGLSQIWSGIKATETLAVMQHEYIRKDALLEWAKEVTNDTNHSRAYRGAYRDLINKLNSL